MPQETTQATIDLVTPYAVGLGVPEEMVPAVFAAMTAAGVAAVMAEAETPVSIADTTPGECVKVAGMPGTFLCSAQLGTTGFVTWIRTLAKDGTVHDSEPTFVAKSGELLG